MKFNFKKSSITLAAFHLPHVADGYHIRQYKQTKKNQISIIAKVLLDLLKYLKIIWETNKNNNEIITEWDNVCKVLNPMLIIK